MPLESEASFENFMKRRKHGKKSRGGGRGGADYDSDSDWIEIYTTEKFIREKRNLEFLTHVHLQTQVWYSGFAQ